MWNNEWKILWIKETKLKLSAYQQVASDFHCSCKLNIFGFGLFARQDKTSKVVTLDPGND